MTAGGRQPQLMLLAGAQWAPGFLVVDEMPAHARTQGVRQGLVVFAVAWSFHERTPYPDRLTLLSKHGGITGRSHQSAAAAARSRILTPRALAA